MKSPPLLLIFIVFLTTLNKVSAEAMFNRILVIDPQKTITIVIATDIALSFNAEFENMSYVESRICGNCLHIKNVSLGTVNTAASNLGVGFVVVQPVDGKVSVDVYHDYKIPKIIKVTAVVYSDNFDFK